ncbi:MAG: carbohydrate ABC transporter permease [Bifidobacteriaceae bacterium]|nr:carbohydrate ABC transporter permease [Bifidobacteriaceae bacterium]
MSSVIQPVTVARRPRNYHRLAVKIGLGVAVGVILLWVLLPLYYLFVTSLSPNSEPVLGWSLPRQLTLENYRSIILGGPGQPVIWGFMLTSIIVAGGAMLLSFVVAFPAAYGLSRLTPSKGANRAYVSFLGLQALPTIALVAAFYMLYSKLGLLNTKPGLLCALLTIGVPLEVWVLKAFCDAIPREVEEAATLDGAGTLKRMVRIIIPFMGDGIASTAALTFLQLYVDYLFAVTLTDSSSSTVPVYVTGFQNELSVNVGATCAAAVISMIPMLAVFGVAQRYSKGMALMGA